MMKKLSYELLSTVIFIATVVLALILYVVILSSYENILSNFHAMFWLCFVTFLAGVGILASAILREKNTQENPQ